MRLKTVGARWGWFVLALPIMLLLIGCGGAAVMTAPESTPKPAPIDVQPEIVDLDVENDAPAAIVIKLDDGRQLRLRLGESINLEDWSVAHLDGHRRTGIPLFVTYEERPGEFVATNLSE